MKLPRRRDKKGRFTKPPPLDPELVQQLGQDRKPFYFTLERRWKLRLPKGWRPSTERRDVT